MHSILDFGPLLTAADFEPHVGKDYLVDATPKSLRIRLDAITQRPIDPEALRQPFMLIFTTPWSDLLLEGTYRMQPNGGRQVEMYLNPTQTAQGPRRFYHAIFN